MKNIQGDADYSVVGNSFNITFDKSFVHGSVYIEEFINGVKIIIFIQIFKLFF